MTLAQNSSDIYKIMFSYLRAVLKRQKRFLNRLSKKVQPQRALERRTPVRSAAPPAEQGRWGTAGMPSRAGLTAPPLRA